MSAAPTIRELGPEDAAAFQRVRLEGLRRHPTAFTADVDAFAAASLDEIGARLSRGGVSFVLGGFHGDRGDELVGVVGFHREAAPKLAHRGTIWGMYVRDEAQGRGIGELLLEAALDRARRQPGLAVIEIGVEANNGAARRLYERCGFERWAVQRDALRVDGHAYDEWLMQLQVRTPDAESG